MQLKSPLGTPPNEYVTPNKADVELAIRWSHLNCLQNNYFGFYQTVYDLLMSGY